MNWRYAAASAIGTSHQESPEPVCQDAHALRFLPDSNILVAAVSDGAGSASLSHIGSRLTCDLVVESVARAPSGIVLTSSFASEVLEQLRKELQQAAGNTGAQLSDFACTMLVAVVSEYSAAFWQIGDGAICFRERDAQKYRYAFWPAKGAYANVTCFVTDGDAQLQLLHELVPCEIADLAVFSDGLERLALDFVAKEAHAAFFDGLFPHVHDLQVDGYSAALSDGIAGFLSSERVNRRTDDDKTLVLASSMR